MAEDYCTYEDVLSHLKGMDLDAWTEEEIVRFIDQFANEIDELSGTSFRETRIEDELHTAKIAPYPEAWETALAVHLQHSPVRAIEALKVYSGSGYDDWIALNKVEARDGDYWVDYDLGIVYLMTSRYWTYGLEAKVTYTYGEKKVPTRVWELNIQYTVRHILTQLAHVVAVPEGGQNPIESRLSKCQDRIEYLETKMTGWKNVDEGQWE